MKRFKVRSYGHHKFGILDTFTSRLIKDDEGYLILFNSKKEAKEYIDFLEV